MSSTDRFSQCALAWILDAEGGYVWDPADAGGETKFGISKAAYPQLNIADLTEADAAAIYRRDYWDAFHCGEFPAGLDLALCDAAIQHQPKSARMLVQGALGVATDGDIGPVTIAAAAQRGASPAVLTEYFARRADLYSDIVMANTRQAKFRHGWMIRLFRLHRYILTGQL